MVVCSAFATCKFHRCSNNATRYSYNAQSRQWGVRGIARGFAPASLA
ncbi:hypothetical protein ZEAMMB73_Zm00001d004488 [Zea mays]|nr:ABC transporter A family member 7 [Zea mays]ONM19017.1 hypothetical protein ZEAMMB73_Zm00001d004488 [Zea mays]